MSVEQLEAAVTQLPEDDRRHFIHVPPKSLPEECWPTKGEFLDELRRIDADVRSGRDPGLSREQAMLRMRRTTACD